jgi:hypothetical protein
MFVFIGTSISGWNASNFGKAHCKTVDEAVKKSRGGRGAQENRERRQA